jgi:threonine/homoserine/homoserine lactone efflux protein
VINLSAALGVMTIALGMVLTPGPNMMYLVSRSITQGRRAGVVSLIGVAAGFLVYLVATNLGLSVVFIVVPQLFIAIKIAGAAYLAWLAWKAFKPGGISVFTPQEIPPDSHWRLFTMGMVTNLLNPKIAVMYLSLIPQFVQLRAGHVLLQGLLLGGVQIVVAVTVNLVIVTAAGTISTFLARRPAWLRVQRYAMGTALGTLAVTLALGATTPASSLRS